MTFGHDTAYLQLPTEDSAGTPAREFVVDESLVRRLLADQHPDLAALPLLPVEAGWDNAMFRLGDRLAVRVPVRAAAASLILHEQAWLPKFAARLPLPIPAPVRVGVPALGYPWHWSVIPWLPGQSADQHQPNASQASILANFLRSVHTPAPPDAPTNAVRGVPLRQRVAAIQPRLDRLIRSTNLVTPSVVQIWQEALDAPLDVAPTWLHGDLHPRNVLVEGGALSGIIDWGDMTAGDRATDLASIWMLFADREAQRAALEHYGDVSESTIKRAQGWAVLLGVVLLDTGLVDNPRHAAMGTSILQRVASSR